MTTNPGKAEQATRALAADLVEYYTRPDASEAQRVRAMTVASILDLADLKARYMPKAEADAIVQAVATMVAEMLREGEAAITQAMENAPKGTESGVGRTVAQLQAIRGDVAESRMQAMLADHAERAWQKALAELEDFRVPGIGGARE